MADVNDDLPTLIRLAQKVADRRVGEALHIVYREGKWRCIQTSDAVDANHLGLPNAKPSVADALEEFILKR